MARPSGEKNRCGGRWTDLSEELLKVQSDELVYGNGFLHFSEGKVKHIPAKEILVAMGVEVIDEVRQ